MYERICPKCGVIYSNGQRECEECGSLLKNATETDKARFEAYARRKSAKASALSSRSIPTKDHIITAIAIPLYSLLMGILFGGAFFGITFWNLFISAVSFIPRIKICIGKTLTAEDSEPELKRIIKIERFYYPVITRIVFIVTGIFNLMLTAVNIEEIVK